MNELNPASASPSTPLRDSRSCHHGHRRGGFFRALAFGALVFAAVAGGVYVGKSHAHPGVGAHAIWQGNFDPESAGKRIDAMVSFALADVDATAEQKIKISGIAREALKDLVPLRDTHKSARNNVVAILTATTVDRAVIEQLRVAELQLAETASKRMTQAIADAAEVLQPAQRVKLAEKMKERMARHG